MIGSELATAAPAPAPEAAVLEQSEAAAIFISRNLHRRRGELDNVWQIWMWWDSDERNWMWQDDNGWWNPNWQPPWRWRNDGERNWSAQTWRESSSWGSMEE